VKPEDKMKIESQLVILGSQMTAAAGLLNALPPVLPPAPAGAPIQTAPLVAPLTNALKMQNKASQDLVKILTEIVKKS